mgnify:CR=1 FL=1
MPWLTYPYSSPSHVNLRQKFEIVGVPMVLVLEANTGFLISKKGRKDICDLGVGCMKNWHEELPDMVAKVEHLTKGAAIVEKRRLMEEEEA